MSISSIATYPIQTPFLHIQEAGLQEHVKKAIEGPIIYFGNRESIFSFLNNDYLTSFEFGGFNYMCATAVYEAQKFSHRIDLLHRFTYLDAAQAFSLSAEMHFENHGEWYSKREEIMYHVLRAKFGQNLNLREGLVATADTYLSYSTPFQGMDPFWTDNADGSGENRLGVLLMRVRQEYGGIGEVNRPIRSIPNENEQKCTLLSLTKSKEMIQAEIDLLNSQMNELNYKENSQIARCSSTHALTRFPHNNFPYDQTLVPLSSGRFINASFVLDKQYIGTQSPMPETREDFWSMFIEHQASIAIMLNRRSDPGYEIYFPLTRNHSMQYGNIYLELLEEPMFITDPSWRHAPHEEEPHAIIHRRIKMHCEGLTKTIHHFQYQNWRDFSAGNERATAHLVKKVSALQKEMAGPVVVHCHAGVGRTSAMITLLDQYPNLAMDQVDIQRSVERQRSPEEGRCHSMMQSSDQYAFCYRVLRFMQSDSK